MSTGQIIIYILILLIVFIYLKKFLDRRKIKHYNATEASNKMKSRRDILLLDVRTNDERKAEYIKGSLHIPLNELSNKSESLRKFKDKEIVCYCRSGNRSLAAALLLHKNGYNAANLSGGITAWNYQNLK
jgi:rhodanese-related sulfurtransferase